MSPDYPIIFINFHVDSIFTDNMLVHDRKKYVINENVTNDYTFKLTLKIVKVKKSDYGTYKCISKNSIGESEGVIRIHGKYSCTFQTTRRNIYY